MQGQTESVDIKLRRAFFAKFLAVAITLAVALVTLGVLNASAAQAGTLVVTKGGDRNVNSNSFTGAPNYAQNLAGAQFEYSSSPSGPWTAISGSTGANGQVSINLPSGTYYVRERSAAPGFTNFGPLQTISFDNTTQQYAARVSVGTSGTTYAYPHSDTDRFGNWSPTNGVSSSNNGSPFIDVRDNGTVTNSCGQNILLVLDRSGSIDPYKDSYMEAAQQFVNQLNGTPTQIGILSFASDVNSYSPSQGSSSLYHSPMDLSNSGSAAALNTTISNVYSGPSGATNWDGALQAASKAKGFTTNTNTGQTTNPDMVVFITDGNPTISEIDDSGGSNTSLSDISTGIASANLVKTQPSRPGKKLKMLAIGVGSGVTASNLSVVSGPVQGVNGDYAVPTIPELDDFLQELAATQCGARIYVRKRIAGDDTNQASWKYTAFDPRPGHSPSYLDGNNATHPNGNPPVVQTGAFFTNLPASATTVQVNENATGQPVSNFSLTDVTCREGSYDSGDKVTGTQNGLNFSLSVNRGDEIYCTYTNSVKTTLSITKTPDNGTITAGDDAEFTIDVKNTGSNTASAAVVSDQLPAPGVGGWTVSQQPSGGNCTINGSNLLGCNLGNLTPNQTVTIKVKTGTDKDHCGTYNNPAAKASAANADEVTDAGKITCQKPSLEVTKSATNSPINAGDDAGFSITLKNNGPGTAKGATLNDTLPAGLAWQIDSNPGNVCQLNGQNLTCNFGDLTAGQSRTVTIKAPTTADNCKTWDNTATGSATNGQNATGSASVKCQTAGLGVLKTAVHATINAGENAEFTIVTSNTGAGTAKGVKMTDPLPGGVSGPWTITNQPSGNPCSITGNTLDCNFGDLASGESRSVTVSAPTNFDNCTKLDNTASATSTNAPGANDSASINCQKPNLSVTKTAASPTVNAGEDVKFTIKTANAGPGMAKAVTLNDPLPAGTGGWTIESQPAGNPCSITGGTLSCTFGDMAANTDRTVTIKASTSAQNCGIYDNKATARSTNSPDASGQDKITCQKPALIVTKNAAHSPISAGDDAEYSITLGNSGPGTAKGASLSDPLPAGVAGAWTIVDQPSGNPCSITSGTLNCNFGDLASSQTRTVTVKAPTSYQACTKLDNSATGKASNSTDVTASASINCQKPDLKVTKSAANGTISAGDDAEFTITMKNNGPGTAKSANLSDPLPTGVAGAWTIVDQPSGNPCTITGNALTCGWGDLASGENRSVTVKAPTSFEACSKLDNTATGTASNSPNATDSASINCQKPGLTVTKTAASDTINAGDDVQFQIKVENTGAGTAQNVTLSDPLPGGTMGSWSIVTQPPGNHCSITGGTLNCDFGALASGASQIVTVKAGTGYDACTTYDNTATAHATGVPNASDSATVTCDKPNLATLKTAVHGSINAGENAEFTIKVSNSGPGTAKAVTLSDPLPAGVSGAWTVTNQPTGDPCSISGGVLSCDFGDLQSGESRTVTVSAPTDFEHCSKLNNTATASSDNSPDAPGSDSIECKKPALSIEKTAASGTVNAGDDVKFTVKTANAGPGTAKAVKLSDPLPAGVSGSWAIESQPAGDPCSITAGSLNCDFGDLAAGQDRTVTVKAATSAEACTVYDNTATVHSSNAPDASDQAKVTCNKGAVGVLKTAVHATINAGENAEFTIVTSNSGEGVAKDVKLNDPLPTGVSGPWTITDQPAGDPCSITGGTLTCNFGDLAKDEKRSVTVSAPTDFEHCTTLDNTATATSSNAPEAEGSDSINCKKPNLSVEKTAASGTVNAGDDVKFTVKTANAGPGTAKAVKLSDPLPAGVSGSWAIESQPAGDPCSITAGKLNCDFGDLAAGQDRTVTVKAPTSFEHCTTYDNTATAHATNAPDATSEEASVACQKPNVSVEKTAASGTVNAGDDVKFTVKTANAGPGTAKAVKLSDPLPAGVSGSWAIESQPAGDPCSITAGTLNCDFGDLAAGQDRTVTVSAPTSFEHCTTYDNTATAHATNAPDATSEEASVACQKPNVSVEKTAASGTVNAGDDVKFTVKTANAGPGTAKAVKLSDPLPAGVSGSWAIESQPAGDPCSITAGTLNCDFGDLAAGQDRTVTVKAATSAEHCTVYDNTATVHSSNAPDASDQAKVTCNKGAVGVLKTAVHATINAGENAEFTIVTSNSGEGVAKDVKLNDPLPAGVSGPWTITDQPAGDPCAITGGTLTCEFGDLSSGESRSVTVSAPTDFEHCTTLDNTATATSSNAPEAEGSDSINCKKPNLSVEKTAASGTVNAGDDVKFTIKTSNAGPGTAKGVTLSDPLPGGTSGDWVIDSQPAGDPCSITGGTLSCDFGDLAEGDSREVKIKAPTDKTDCTVYDNTATAHSTNAPDATSEKATVTCQKPDLATLKTAVHGTINAGDKAEFTISVTNKGPGAAKGVTLNDPLPAGVSGDWTITDQPDDDPVPCAITDGKLICDFGDLGANETRSVTVSAPTNFENCTTLLNKATASGDNAADADGSATIYCEKPKLTVHKSGNGTVNAGEDVEFTIAVANSGPGVARNVTLSDSVPSGVAGAWTISSQPAGNPCAITAGKLTCNFGDMQGQSRNDVKISAHTDYEHCATWNNTAVINADNSPEMTSDASVICQKPEVAITKKGNGKTGPGKNVSFTIEVTNRGQGTAHEVVVADQLNDLVGGWAISSQSEAAGCQIVHGTPGFVRGAGAESGTWLVCEVGDLKPGAVVTITVSGRMNGQVCRAVDNKAIVTASNAPRAEADASVPCVKPTPKLQLRKKADRKVVLPGKRVHYTILVRNRKIGSVATNLTMCDRIPPHMTVVNRGSAHFRNGKLCWSIPRLEGSKKWTKFHYTTKVDLNAKGGQHLRNVVTLRNLRAHWTVRVKHPPVRHRRRHHSRVTG